MVGRADARVRVAVVGTGLIGGSVLLRLRDTGLDVAGWDPDPATRRRAREQGILCPDVLEEAVAGRDVVFLCGPLPTLSETLTRVAAATEERCVLTDVGSTKAQVAAAATASCSGADMGTTRARKTSMTSAASCRNAAIPFGPGQSTQA
ncbi:hypothetical protein DLE60_10040, partial [Micromonospora globispora]|uniref:prephenate dehydrogenase/arogenate dehydrogenase family protein n=1 Tax=Micromonospora globispora TaxID=1450148 RepID=UPI000D88493E